MLTLTSTWNWDNKGIERAQHISWGRIVSSNREISWDLRILVQTLINLSLRHQTSLIRPGLKVYTPHSLSSFCFPVFDIYIPYIAYGGSLMLYYHLHQHPLLLYFILSLCLCLSPSFFDSNCFSFETTIAIIIIICSSNKHTDKHGNWLNPKSDTSWIQTSDPTLGQWCFRPLSYSVVIKLWLQTTKGFELIRVDFEWTINDQLQQRQCSLPWICNKSHWVKMIRIDGVQNWTVSSTCE